LRLPGGRPRPDRAGADREPGRREPVDGRGRLSGRQLSVAGGAAHPAAVGLGRLLGPMRASTIRAWSWAHTWSSLVSTLFLLMLCVTGLPLVFAHEIDEALLDQDWAPAAAEAPGLDLDQVLQTALSRHP